MDEDIEVPGGESTILLHTCCAPCSCAIIENLLKNGIAPVIFFCNPNIFPDEEYLKRKNECIRFAETLGIRFIDDDCRHSEWREAVRGLENEPERGARCLECFRYRLFRTAEFAHKNGFRVISTTLASSRWKNLEQINEAGRAAVSRFDDVLWWDRNWRKGGLQERRNVLIKELGFYNQQYCGCEFSLRQKQSSL